jgi:dihydropteroate synthase
VASEMTRYIRPLSLSFGQDARNLVHSGVAGSLGGHSAIAFSRVEVIERGNGPVERYTKSFQEVISESLISAITAPRVPFAGVDLETVRIMGIVNVTPDSFSDGGKFATAEFAIQHGKKLFDEGADFVDVGGESTRPGSDTLDPDKELARVLPVITGLAPHGLVSVDTRKSAVMRQAAAQGARIINDVSALAFDTSAVKTVADTGLPVVIMHAQGPPKTMQLSPKYDDVVLDVYDYLSARIEALVASGIPASRIMIDPGIGFGKTYRNNLDVLAHLTIFHGLGVPLLVGLSRKSIVGALTGEKIAGERVAGSGGGALQAACYGAHVLRVHDVKPTIDALRMFWGAMDPDSVDV